MPPTRERRWWTSQEDDILKSGVRIQDGSVQNWNDIAILLPGRTNKDCRKRWSKVQLYIRKGAWTRDEDERLQQAVQQIGAKWSQVAVKVQSRNADRKWIAYSIEDSFTSLQLPTDMHSGAECAKRWQHVLGPDFKHFPWTPEEDRKLLEAMIKHKNNWKQIGLTDLPDRSTHDIRNRSLLLGRRSRKPLARDPISARQLTASTSNDDAIGDGLDRPDDNDDDSDAYDGNSEYEYADSAGLNQPQESSGTATIQQETIVTTESEPDSRNITHFQQPHAPLAIPQGTGSYFDPIWTGAMGQIQTCQELPTPGSDSLSYFDQFEASASTMAGSPPSWWTDSPMHKDCFQSSEPFEIGLFDMPGSNDDSRCNVHVESNGGNTSWEKERKGSVTLTLSQVDADVAQEIMGSVLKHSAGLKIRCIVNED